MLKQKKYLHILDRNVAQFEPDHPVFIRVAEAVYDRVDANGDWDRLWSTRHYGPMVFHLIWQRKVDDLLAHFLQSINRKDRMEAVSDVLLLFTRYVDKLESFFIYTSKNTGVLPHAISSYLIKLFNLLRFLIWPCLMKCISLLNSALVPETLGLGATKF